MKGKMVKMSFVLLAVMLVLAQAHVFAGGSGESSSGAANYPNKPIRVLIANAAGGGADRMVRTVAQFSKKYLGVEMIVENMPGAAQTLAHTYYKSVPNDGYTIIVHGNSGTTVTPFLQKVEYEPLIDEEAVGRLANDLNVVVVHKDAPVNNFEEFIAYTKAHPNTKIATSGVNGIDDFQIHLMNRACGIDVLPVAYDSGSEAVLAVLGGECFAANTSAASAGAQYDAGMIKFLVFLTDEPDPKYTHIPTAKSLGYDAALDNSLGFAVKKGTDPAIKQILADFIMELPNDPDYLKAMSAAGLTVAPLSMPDFQQFLQAEVEKVQLVVSTLGLASQ